MNLSKASLGIIFTVSFLLTILIPAVYPNLRLMFFVPFLITAYYQKPLPLCLWFAFLCGILIDLLSVQAPFGFYAFNYIVATILLFPQRRNFFSDHLSTLPIMTFLFSVISTFLQIVFLYVLGQATNIGLGWVLTDLIIMPSLDALYSFFAFILIPIFILKTPKKRNI
jgi:rod shape-determining protein MreD